ncbi:hypothetical protein PIB30_075956, partial [Stylosanthes scabra]|nr:hypothetical protein [Stylosanthes scabra]
QPEHQEEQQPPPPPPPATSEIPSSSIQCPPEPSPPRIHEAFRETRAFTASTGPPAAEHAEYDPASIFGHSFHRFDVGFCFERRQRWQQCPGEERCRVLHALRTVQNSKHGVVGTIIILWHTNSLGYILILVKLFPTF